MVDTYVRQRVGRRYPAGRSASGLLVPKLRRPRMRLETVRRSLLIERLAEDDQRPIVSVVAPPGYGKTTLLSQWAEREGQAFAWVSVEDLDNDPRVFLTHIAEALDEVEPIDRRVFDALASPASSVARSVVPRLGSALWSMTLPLVLVLDDVHVLRNQECQAAVSVLADHMPGGSRLALAGRAGPPLPIARLRAEGKIMEIGPDDLSFTRQEASLLLRKAGVALGEDEMAKLYRRTEGWPAGLSLAALDLAESDAVAGAEVPIDRIDSLVSEYVITELLSQICARQRAFLTQAAVLERMSAPLCETVLDMEGASATLADLARSGLLVPLDRHGEWYRYHHLFRDILLAELLRQEPELVLVLRRRAADWFWRNDRPEEAVGYSAAAEDTGAVAGMIESLGALAYRQGQLTTLQRWFRWLEDRGGIEGHPMTAVLDSLLSAMTGRPAEAEQWASAVDHCQYGNVVQPDNPSAWAWAALLRAILCRRGVERMRTDADEALERFAAGRFVTPAPALLQGLALILCGDLDGGDLSLEDAIGIAEVVGAPEDLALALCERALVAMARSEWDQAGTFADRAHTVLRRARIEESYATALVCAVRARTAIYQANLPAARRELASAQRLRPLLTYALPHLAIQARIELVHVHLALADLAGARTLLREIDELLRHRPSLGTLVGAAEALRAQLSSERGSTIPVASPLTAAELRLLPLLSTHLSFPEIGAKLVLSRNTVKSHANSIYRKLGVSSRSQAVSRSLELGLLAG